MELAGGESLRLKADPSERPRQLGSEQQRRVSDGHPRGRGRGDPRAIDSRPEALRRSAGGKAAEWKDILKIGRTHLADATPLSLGQEIGGLARQLERSAGRAAAAMQALFELPIGGTAVGTGINTHVEFGRRVCEILAKETGIPFVEAANHFEANAQRDGLVECHGQLRTIASTLFNVANNIRWLASGPRCGFHEIKLPDRQPGSSIMPGKVNPVLCESVMQVAARVLGNDQTIVLCGAAGGQFQLNVMMPVMADAVLESIRLLANATERSPIVPGRHGGRCGSVRGVGREKPCDGHRLEAVHRLRVRGGTGQGGVCHGQDDPRALPRKTHPSARNSSTRPSIRGG